MIDTYKLLSKLPSNYTIVPYTIKVPPKYMFKTKDIVKIKLNQILTNLKQFCSDNNILFHNLVFFENHKNSREHLHGWLFIETKYIDKIEMYMLKRQQNLNQFFWISGNSSGDYYYNLNYLTKDLKDIKYYNNNNKFLKSQNAEAETKKVMELIKSIMCDVLQELSNNSSKKFVKSLLNILNKVSKQISLSEIVKSKNKQTQHKNSPCFAQKHHLNQFYLKSRKKHYKTAIKKKMYRLLI